VPRLVVRRDVEPDRRGPVGGHAPLHALSATEGADCRGGGGFAGFPVPIVDVRGATAAVVAECFADERLAPTPSQRVPDRQLELLVTDLLRASRSSRGGFSAAMRGSNRRLIWSRASSLRGSASR
jgi:hypothetical protein